MFDAKIIYCNNLEYFIDLETLRKYRFWSELRIWQDFEDYRYEKIRKRTKNEENLKEKLNQLNYNKNHRRIVFKITFQDPFCQALPKTS